MTSFQDAAFEVIWLRVLSKAVEAIIEAERAHLRTRYVFSSSLIRFVDEVSRCSGVGDLPYLETIEHIKETVEVSAASRLMCPSGTFIWATARHIHPAHPSRIARSQFVCDHGAGDIGFSKPCRFNTGEPACVLHG